VVVVMEWVPNAAVLALKRESDFKTAPIPSAARQDRLRHAFDLLDIAQRQALSLEEFKELVYALDVDAEADGRHTPGGAAGELMALLQRADSNGNGLLEYQELQRMVTFALHQKLQAGRFFVALSLHEAESVRGIIHMRRGARIIDFSQAAIGLRVGDMLLDQSQGFTSAHDYQLTQALQLFRFANSDLFFSERGSSMALRALENTPPAKRETWFEEVCPLTH
jgi:hypothetical protein